MKAWGRLVAAGVVAAIAVAHSYVAIWFGLLLQGRAEKLEPYFIIVRDGLLQPGALDERHANVVRFVFNDYVPLLQSGLVNAVSILNAIAGFLVVMLADDASFQNDPSQYRRLRRVIRILGYAVMISGFWLCLFGKEFVFQMK